MSNAQLERTLGAHPPLPSPQERQASVQRATAEVKFFTQLKPQEHMELCRVMTFELVPKDTAVFSQGDEGTTFYVIHLGAAKVLVHDWRSTKAHGTCVCTLEDGDSFGELALLGNGIRNATVMTAMPCQLLKVEKEAYERSLQKLHEAELRRRIAFLQRIFLFSEWADEDLRRLAFVLTRKRFEKASTILSPSVAPDHVNVSSCWLRSEKYCFASCDVEVPSPL